MGLLQKLIHSKPKPAKLISTKRTSNSKTPHDPAEEPFTTASKATSLTLAELSLVDSSTTLQRPTNSSDLAEIAMALPFDLRLLIAETSPQTWMTFCVLFRDIGLYSLDENVQHRMKVKFQTEHRLVTDGVTSIFFLLPNGRRYGRYARHKGSVIIKELWFNKIGKKSGIYQSWYDNKRIQKECTYDEAGMLHGVYLSWYNDGQKSEEIVYNHGKKDGKCLTWYGNGNKWKECTYK
jgi:hypothetical protein